MGCTGAAQRRAGSSAGCVNWPVQTQWVFHDDAFVEPVNAGKNLACWLYTITVLQIWTREVTLVRGFSGKAWPYHSQRYWQTKLSADGSMRSTWVKLLSMDYHEYTLKIFSLSCCWKALNISSKVSQSKWRSQKGRNIYCIFFQTCRDVSWRMLSVSSNCV